MLSAAFERRDQRVVTRVMESLRASKYAVPIVRWASQDLGFISTDWGFQEIARSAIRSVGQPVGDEDAHDTASQLFARTVEQRRWDVGLWFIDLLIEEATSPQAHVRQPLCELFIQSGQTLWLTEDNALRPVTAGSRLEHLQTVYLVRIGRFAHGLAGTGDDWAMEMLIGGLSTLMFEAGDGDWDSFVNKVYDAMRVAFEGKVLTRLALLEFATEIGHMSHRVKMEKDQQEWLNWNVMQIAAHLAQIGGTDEELKHLFANGRVRPGSPISVYAEGGVDEDNYKRAAALGGIKLQWNPPPIAIELIQNSEE